MSSLIKIKDNRGRMPHIFLGRRVCHAPPTDLIYFLLVLFLPTAHNLISPTGLGPPSYRALVEF